MRQMQALELRSSCQLDNNGQVVRRGQWTVVHKDIPTPGRGEVLIQTARIGLCGSDMDAYLFAPDHKLPKVLGHEVGGVVVATGPGVKGLAPGDPVAVWVKGRDGFGEYVAAEEVNCVLAATVERPELAEPAGCAFNVVDKVNALWAAKHWLNAPGRRRQLVGLSAALPEIPWKPPRSVMIIGPGFIGLTILELVRLTAPEAQIIVVGRRPNALPVARELGADDAVDSTERSPVELIRNLTRGRGIDGLGGADIVYEATATQAGFDLATQAAAMEGMVVRAGYSQEGTRRLNLATLDFLGNDLPAAHFRTPQTIVGGMRNAVGMMANGLLRSQRLVTHEWRVRALDEIPDIFRILTEEKPADCIKAVIRLPWAA